MNRRDIFKYLGLGTVAVLAGKQGMAVKMAGKVDNKSHKVEKRGPRDTDDLYWDKVLEAGERDSHNKDEWQL